MDPLGSSHPGSLEADLVRRIPHGVFTVRLGAGGRVRFEDASPLMGELLGLDPGALLDDPGAALATVHAEDLPDLLRAVVADFRRHGFDAYLNKPYTMDALRETLAV